MPRLHVLFVLSLLCSNCQFIADFDRSKIDQDASVDSDVDGSDDASTNADGSLGTDSGTANDSGTEPIVDAGGDV